MITLTITMKTAMMIPMDGDRTTLKMTLKTLTIVMMTRVLMMTTMPIMTTMPMMTKMPMMMTMSMMKTKPMMMTMTTATAV